MTSVLHPVGPEPEERYWFRRIAVLAAVLVALVVVVALVTNATRAGSAVQAAPLAPPPPLAPPLGANTPTPTTSAVATTSSAAPSATAKAPANSEPSATSTRTPSKTTSTTKTPRKAPPQKTPPQKAPPQKTPAKKTPAQKTPAKKTPAKKTPAQKAPVAPACSAGQLKTTIDGKRSLGVQQRTSFDLSLVNRGDASCKLRVTGENFTLIVGSGKTQIWTSKDCSKATPELSQTLDRGKALTWSMTWNGKFSVRGCKSLPRLLQPGTYWAQAHFDDAKPVRIRMLLHS